MSPKKARVDVKELNKKVNKLMSERDASKCIIANFNSSISSTGVISPLGNMAQGAGSEQRIGNSVRLTWCHARVHLHSNTVSPQDNELARILVIRKEDAQGVTPTFPEFLHDLTGVGTNYSVMSPIKSKDDPFGGNLCTVLYDKTVTLSSQTPNKYFEFKFKFPNKITQYAGTGSANWDKNAYFICVLGNITLASGNYGTYYIDPKVYFKDN